MGKALESTQALEAIHGEPPRILQELLGSGTVRLANLIRISRQRDRGENANDHDDDHQFHQRKAADASSHTDASPTR